MSGNIPPTGEGGRIDCIVYSGVYLCTIGRNFRNSEKIQMKEGSEPVIITIISKLDEAAQAWTFDIDEKDLVKIMEKYGHRGESVLMDADELPQDIREYYE